MLDNLRAMVIFASVVNHGSFGGAAKELGITTSAVSQQIRALEGDLGVVLLHRSTRKLSLTEAGANLYDFAKNIVKSAQEAKDSINRLRDGIFGSLRLATTPKLAYEHIFPALSKWLNKHDELSLMIFTNNHKMDMIEERVDLAIYFSDIVEEIDNPLITTKQLLVASTQYIEKYGMPNTFDELKNHKTIGSTNSQPLSFVGHSESIKISSRLATNDDALALYLAKEGYGILKTNQLNAQKYLKTGELIPILPHAELPPLVLHAKTANKEQQPIKVQQCLAVLKDYFANLQN